MIVLFVEWWRFTQSISKNCIIFWGLPLNENSLCGMTRLFLFARIWLRKIQNGWKFCASCSISDNFLRISRNHKFSIAFCLFPWRIILFGQPISTIREYRIVLSINRFQHVERKISPLERKYFSGNTRIVQ